MILRWTSGFVGSIAAHLAVAALLAAALAPEPVAPPEEIAVALRMGAEAVPETVAEPEAPEAGKAAQAQSRGARAATAAVQTSNATEVTPRGSRAKAPSPRGAALAATVPAAEAPAAPADPVEPAVALSPAVMGARSAVAISARSDRLPVAVPEAGAAASVTAASVGVAPVAAPVRRAAGLAVSAAPLPQTQAPDAATPALDVRAFGASARSVPDRSAAAPAVRPEGSVAQAASPPPGPRLMAGVPAGTALASTVPTAPTAAAAVAEGATVPVAVAEPEPVLAASAASAPASAVSANRLARPASLRAPIGIPLSTTQAQPGVLRAAAGHSSVIGAVQAQPASPAVLQAAAVAATLSASRPSLSTLSAPSRLLPSTGLPERRPASARAAPAAVSSPAMASLGPQPASVPPAQAAFPVVGAAPPSADRAGSLPPPDAQAADIPPERLAAMPEGIAFAALAAPAPSGTAWTGAAGTQFDPVSLATVQSFMTPKSVAEGRAHQGDVRDAISQLLAEVPCSRLEAAFVPETGALEIRGHVPDPEQGAAVATRLSAMVGGAIEVGNDILVLPEPTCAVLAGIAGLGLPQSTDQSDDPLVVGAAAQAAVFSFVEGDLLTIALGGADYDAYIYLDYFDAAGAVVHLIPNPRVPPKRVAAKAQVVLGDDPADFGGLEPRVAPPFGRDIALAIASSVPLYAAPRPIQEPAGPYLDWLAAQVSAAQRDPDFKGEWVYFFVDTRPARP